MPPKPKDYTAIAKRYAERVVSGKILASHWVQQACRRQLADLKRWGNGRGTYKWDRKRANRICMFVERMPHIEGAWASRGEKLILQPWQIFILTTIFGWTFWDPKWNAWVRRFRTVYIEMARKQGKSTLSAPIGIYLMCAENEMGQEVYSAATTRDQAKEVWEPAKKMVERDQQFRAAFGVDTSAHSIFHSLTGSKFVAISAEGNSLDGLNGSSIIDELHAHRSRKVWDVLETAKGARSQPLIWSITTAGFDRSGICYEQRTYATKILDGATDDPSYFGIIYTLDPDDDWKDEKNWIKSNPNLDISIDSNELRRLALKAQKMPSALNNFLTKHMSVWVNASVSLFNITQWQALAAPALSREDFRTDRCWVGFDFAPRNDFSSWVQLFRRDLDGVPHYYAFARHYLSEGKIEESENASLSGWARDGWITANPGNQTDDVVIEDDLVKLFDEGYQVQELDCDPSRTQGIEAHVERRTGGTIIEIQQSPRNLCPAVEKLSALIADGKIHHNGDPVLTWMLSNVVGVPKGNWGLYPGKERDENKIDGVQALLTCLCRAMVDEGPGQSAYDERPSFLQL